MEKCSKLLFPSNRNLRLMYSLLNVMQTNLKNTDRALCNGNTWREMTVLRMRAKARGFDESQKVARSHKDELAEHQPCGMEVREETTRVTARLLGVLEG